MQGRMVSQVKLENHHNVDVIKVENFILESSDNTISYNVYYPKEIKKQTSENFKNAIDEIAYSKTSSIIKVIFLLLENVANKINVATPLDEIRTKLKDLQKKEILTQRDYESLIDIIKFKDLQRFYKGNIKTLQANLRDDIYKIIYVWLEGLYLHSCLQLDRKIIQQVIFNQVSSARLVNHPVLEANIKIKEFEAQAINNISRFEAEQSIPCLLAIAHEINAVIIDVPNLEKTKSGIDYAIRLLKDANEKLYTSLFDIPAVLGQLKLNMKKDLEKLVTDLGQCEIDGKIIPHLQELIVWLDGLYAHSYNPPKRSFGGRSIEAAKEKAFKSATDFSKKDVADYYHRAAQVLRVSINNYQNQLVQIQARVIEEKESMQTASVPLNASSEHAKSEIVKQEGPIQCRSITESLSEQTQTKKETIEVSEVFEEHNMIQKNESQNSFLTAQANSPISEQLNEIELVLSDELSVTLKLKAHSDLSAQFQKLDQIKVGNLFHAILKDELSNQVITPGITKNSSGEFDAVNQNLAAPVDLNQEAFFDKPNESHFWKFLDEAKESDSQVKIDALYNALMLPYDLSPQQKEHLFFLKERATKTFEHYKNDTYLKNYLGKVSSVFFPRANQDVAKEAMTKFTQRGKVDEHDPKTILLALYDARSKLLGKDKKSTTLLPNIEKVILKAYKHLLNKKPTEVTEAEAVLTHRLFTHENNMYYKPLDPIKKISFKK